MAKPSVSRCLPPPGFGFHWLANIFFCFRHAGAVEWERLFECVLVREFAAGSLCRAMSAILSADDVLLLLKELRRRFQNPSDDGDMLKDQVNRRVF